MKNSSYEIITREKLVQYIEENEFELKYYFRVCGDYTDKDYEKLFSWISTPSSPRLISGSKLYFDLDISDYNYDDEDDDSTPELFKMINELQYGNLVIVRNILELFGNKIYSEEILEVLSRILKAGSQLCILDYDNGQFIKINVRQLMMYLLEETKYDDIDLPAFKNIPMTEISNKYYDGKLR